SLAQLERGQAGGKQRPVQLAGELLDPREQRAAVEQLGTGLQNPHLPVALHQLDHGYQRFAAHEAVSVQHYHVVVAAPPTAQEVAHVTALVIQVELAPPVEQPARRTQSLDQPCPGRLFAQPDLRLATVGEDEKVEMLELAGAFQAAVDRTEAPQATLDGLVVDGHQDRRARQRRRRQGRRILLAQQGVPVAAQAAQDKAGDGNPETEGDPGKPKRKEYHPADLLPIPTWVGQYCQHEPAGGQRLAYHQQQPAGAAQPGSCALTTTAPARIPSRGTWH